MNAKEVAQIILAVILFAFVASFLQGTNAFLIALLIAATVLAINILAKELTASYLDAKIENRIWHFQRWGYYERSHLKKPFPIGILLPFFLSLFSLGYIKCLTLLQIEIKPSVYRAAKRRGFPKRYSEMTEWHIALIPLIGIVANLALALLIFIFARNISLAVQIAKFSVYYSVWNILPLGQLDGTKILFGSRIWWSIMTALSIVLLVFCFVIS